MTDKLYILQGWSQRDGKTVTYPFTSDEKRQTFFDNMSEKFASAEPDSQGYNYYWSHDWTKFERALDPENATVDIYDGDPQGC